jgi:hypothetical protein
MAAAQPTGGHHLALWRKRVVPYEIGAELAGSEQVREAIGQYHEQDVVEFDLRTPENAEQYPDYVRFVPGDSNFSPVGRIGGPQDIVLAPGFTTGNVLHEIGHALGRIHEHTRSDRDKYVTIQWQNVLSFALIDFAKHPMGPDQLGEYDYQSIMHYSKMGPTKNGKPTILPLRSVPTGLLMGQRSRLSDRDVLAFRRLYRGA